MYLKASQGTSYGHVVEIAGVGKVSLADLVVDRAFHLTMIGIDVDGKKLKVAAADSDGQSYP